MASLQSQARDYEHDQSDEVLPAFWKWLIEARLGHSPARGNRADTRDKQDGLAERDFHRSPTAAPSMDVNPGQDIIRPSGNFSNQPSVGRRVFRIVAKGFIVIAVVCVVFSWLSSSKDQIGDVVRALNWLSSFLQTNLASGSDEPNEVDSKSVPRAALQYTTAQDLGGAQPSSASLAAGVPPKLQDQLERMENDLSVVQRIVEQVAARQEQMAADIGTLQAAEQIVSQRVSSLPQSSIARPHMVSGTVRSSAAVQSPAGHGLSSQSAPPLQLH